MKRFEAQALLTKLALAESLRIRTMVTRIQNYWRLSKRRRVLQCRRRRRRQRLRERAKNKVPDLCDDYLSDDFYNPPRAPIEGGAHLPLGAPFLRGRRTRGMKLTWHVSGIVIDRCFLFSFPHGTRTITGTEVLRMLRAMEIRGEGKHSVARDLLSHMQDFVANSDVNDYGDTPQKQALAKAHLQDAMVELEAIASMRLVDLLMYDPDTVISRLRTLSRNGLKVETAALRRPLHKFLSVSSSCGSKLRDCYSAVDAALGAFQTALADCSADAMEQLARAMDELSTRVAVTGALIASDACSHDAQAPLASRP